MTLKAVPVSQVPYIDQFHEKNVIYAIYNGEDDVCERRKMATFILKENKFVVMGHRGSGMNMLQSCDRKSKAIKENTLRSFNEAANFNVDFIEFDVQVTRDGRPVIFHDIFILTQDEGKLIEKRVTDLTLEEFLSYGPQNASTNVEKPLFRKTKDGRIFEWKVDEDDRFCTLEDVFENASQSVGCNIEFKFDDNRSYKEEELVGVIQAVLQVVFKQGKGRCIMFSSFQPDAARLIKKQQTTYPVFFLTNGGSEIYSDIRRNSLDEAIKLCLEGGLQGIVSEVKAILRNPTMIAKIKESNLSILTYGQPNNEQEVVHLQYMMGVEGVIVDFVKEITLAVSQFSKSVHAGKEGLSLLEKRLLAEKRTPCSDDELSYFRRLVPELIHS
ncbi:glycerophosphodiester phosphodiesterase GDPD3-like isoform X1 [Nicotiana tomentosiformis]|uniref:glycerophosphodiester phosphodiesterase GDPD3-like isoform X1 n=1 Tax=Nicotiana tomentosiformis TaxID=4098 RepID=UPI00051C9CC3|nr:glycerophosphodiester phosphodiesterase GDPD3-like isoform X1 [Nicotiana tomentosiformis]